MSSFEQYLVANRLVRHSDSKVTVTASATTRIRPPQSIRRSVRFAMIDCDTEVLVETKGGEQADDPVEGSLSIKGLSPTWVPVPDDCHMSLKNASSDGDVRVVWLCDPSN